MFKDLSHGVPGSDGVTTLTLMPKQWWSWDFLVMEGPRQLAFVDVSSWWEKGILTVEGVVHRVYREGATSGDFILERQGQVLAQATKPSAFRDTIILRYDGREYILRKKSIWRRAFILMSGGTEIGSLAPNSTWRRDATVTLPESWPRPIGVFVIWLAILLWKRDAHAAAAGGT
jgi:hypothetical protein